MFGKPVYGLTLGGGGARGGAHLGVLAVLREIGYEPDVIVGTSIGGMVAALAGAGMSVSEIEAAIAAADINHLLSIDRLGEGLVGNVGLAAELRKYFGSADLRDLPFKVGVMAVDLRSGERVLIERGPVVEAVLATTAVPGLFPAVGWGERLLVDGGVMSNLPTEATYALGAQRVVAVDVAGRFDLDLALSDLGTLSRRLQRLLYWLLSLSNRQAAFDTLIQSTILSYHALARYEMAAYPPDVLIHPHLPALGLMAMENILDTAPAGREAAEAAAPAIRALMRRPYLLHQRPTHGPPPLVRVGAHPREEAEWA